MASARRGGGSSTVAKVRRDLLGAGEYGDPGDPGLFGPDTVIWRVNRENVLLLGGGRALILQVAHPLVAAGVSQHSNYRRDPWGRLYRTLDLTTRIVFGGRAEAERAAQQIWATHGRVRGKSDEAGGRFGAGTPYDARDPELLMWVHATLLDTALLVYERFVGPLGPIERERYYEEQKLLGERFGIPSERQPATYSDFAGYFERMVADELAVTDALRDVVDATLDPELPLAARPLAAPAKQAFRLVTAGTLPPRLRDELGLPWGPGRERLLRTSRRAIRRLLPLLPGPLREFPQARGARRRMRSGGSGVAPTSSP